MIVVVEGIDRVGKTTLCNKLSKTFGYKVFKHDGSEFDYSLMDNTNETDKMYQLIELMKLTGGDIIFDRFHLSEFAYGVVNRFYDVNKAYENMLFIDDVLSKTESLLIKVKPVDIKRSSEEHGVDLTLYNGLIETGYEASKMHKCEATYDQFMNELVYADFVLEYAKFMDKHGWL